MLPPRETVFWKARQAVKDTNEGGRRALWMFFFLLASKGLHTHWQKNEKIEQGTNYKGRENDVAAAIYRRLRENESPETILVDGDVNCYTELVAS